MPAPSAGTLYQGLPVFLLINLHGIGYGEMSRLREEVDEAAAKRLLAMLEPSMVGLDAWPEHCRSYLLRPLPWCDAPGWWVSRYPQRLATELDAWMRRVTVLGPAGERRGLEQLPAQAAIAGSLPEALGFRPGEPPFGGSTLVVLPLMLAVREDAQVKIEAQWARAGGHVDLCSAPAVGRAFTAALGLSCRSDALATLLGARYLVDAWFIGSRGRRWPSAALPSHYLALGERIRDYHGREGGAVHQAFADELVARLPPAMARHGLFAHRGSAVVPFLTFDLFAERSPEIRADQLAKAYAAYIDHLRALVAGMRAAGVECRFQVAGLLDSSQGRPVVAAACGEAASLAVIVEEAELASGSPAAGSLTIIGEELVGPLILVAALHDHRGEVLHQYNLYAVGFQKSREETAALAEEALDRARALLEPHHVVILSERAGATLPYDRYRRCLSGIDAADVRDALAGRNDVGPLRH